MFCLVSFQEIILKCLSEVYPDFLETFLIQKLDRKASRELKEPRIWREGTPKCSQQILSCDTSWEIGRPDSRVYVIYNNIYYYLLLLIVLVTAVV